VISRNMLYMDIFLCAVVLLGCVVSVANDEKPGGPYVYNDTRPSQMGFKPTWDSRGYVFFCLCMGAFSVWHVANMKIIRCLFSFQVYYIVY